MSVTQLDVALDSEMPHADAEERAVLGSILHGTRAAAFWRVVGIVDSDDFFREAHRAAFRGMKRLAERNVEIDLLTLKDDLAKHGELDRAGGPVYVSSLTDGIPDIANVERYAHTVKEKSTLRRLALMGHKVLAAASGGQSDASELLAETESQLYAIASGAIDRGFVKLDSVTRENMRRIEQLHETGRLLTGVPTGYEEFDRFTSGFQPQDLIIIAARPAMGKTSLAMNIAEAMSLPTGHGGPRNGDRLYSVGVFSLEMSKEQIGLRLLSSESGIANQIIRAGRLSQEQWQALAAASSRLAKGQLYIDDTPALSVMDLRARARRLRMDQRVDAVFVDYLQLMTIKGRVESRVQEVSQISRGLKAVAKELNVPLIALSQLSRRPEHRSEDHRPQLADLRESGAIEQDADVVAFIYRDEVYNKETLDRGLAEIIIAKQRNGPIGDFKLVFRSDVTKFYNPPRPSERGGMERAA